MQTPLPPALRAGRRRLSPRPALSFVVLPSSTAEPAQLDNISEHGVGFFARMPLQPDSVIELRCCDAIPVSTTPWIASVRHATLFGGSWLIGCQLRRPLSRQELQAIPG